MAEPVLGFGPRSRAPGTPEWSRASGLQGRRPRVLPRGPIIWGDRPRGRARYLSGEPLMGDCQPVACYLVQYETVGSLNPT
jgi:hypothetical protein